jgi:gamma-glutamyl AIG2-like cyclotransferase
MRKSVALFSYGTLQQAEVQLATYGRLLEGERDALLGYRLEPLAIDDPRVVGVSGKEVHTIARPSADPAHRIPGVLFLLDEAELEATDCYETSAYIRIEAILESGRSAWVYVGPPVGEPQP